MNIQKIKQPKAILLFFSLYFFLSIITVILLARPSSAAIDTCTWTGAVDDTWSEGGNWSGCDNGGVPEDGDSLVFPTGASNLTVDNDITSLEIASLTISGDGYTLTGNPLNAADYVISGADTTISAVLEGLGDLTVSSGTLALEGESLDYNGNIIVQSGAVLTGTVATSLGTTVGVTIVEDGGTVKLAPLVNITTFPEAFSIQGDGASGQCGALVAVHNDSDSGVTTSGAITLLGSATLCRDGAATNSWSINGDITGTGDLTWRSNVATTTVLANIGGGGVSSYVGHTYLDTPLGGALRLSRENAITGDATVTGVGALQPFGAVSSIPDTSVIQLNSPNAKFSSIAGTETVKYVLGAGQLHIDVAGAQMIFNHDDNVTIDASVVPNIPFAGTFIKRGSGIMTWNGNNTRPMTTYNFEDGTLVFNGTMLPANVTNVFPGATLKGTGTLGIVNVTGGIVAPGLSPGTLNVVDLTLDSDSTFEQEIDGPTAGSEYDVLLASGAVTLGDATLNALPTYMPDISHVFTIIEADSVTGTFAGLADGDEFTVDGLTFRINYSATNVTLTFIGGTFVDPSPTPGNGTTSGEELSGNSLDLAETGTSLVLATLLGVGMLASAVGILWRMKVVGKI